MGKLKMCAMNRNGFTFLMTVFMVTIVGILSAFTGKSWTMIMKRDREKELIFRGSQIKEAIENWYDPKYKANGLKWQGVPRPLMNLEDLLENPYVPGLKYLPQSYAAGLDEKNQKCAPDCAKKKILQDPMTGKEWTIIRGTLPTGGAGTATVSNSTQGAGIIGVASKSDETPIKTDFKDTALENMGSTRDVVATGDVGAAGGAVSPVRPVSTGGGTTGMTTSATGLDGKMTKYSQWKFIADPKNDHTKLYRAYHEGW